MSIEKITEQIVQDAGQEAERIRQEAQSRREETLAEARRQAERQLADAREKAGHDGETLVKRRISVAELEARKQKLAVKQDAVSRAFDKTLDRLCSLEESQYIAFLTEMASQLAEEGTLHFNQKDHDTVAPKVVTLLQSMGKKVTLGEETLPIRGGFVLRSGAIEINNTLETLVDSIREDETPRVVQTLFGT
ncbi:MAG: V-type ATP synthase subunit E [Eubacteriales bacterium]|jgi:V/A-type H+-transporting ATPase subunit E